VVFGVVVNWYLAQVGDRGLQWFEGGGGVGIRNGTGVMGGMGVWRGEVGCRWEWIKKVK